MPLIVHQTIFGNADARVARGLPVRMRGRRDMTHCFYLMNDFPVVKDSLSRSFEKVGYKVPWQKLAADFQDETFRFQVLDEGEYKDRDWHDDLKKLLESAV